MPTTLLATRWIDGIMTTHTPGPLEAIGNLVRSPMTQQGERPRGVLIAECRDGYYLEHTDEAKANARLFAAAPDLLEACEKAKEWLEGWASAEPQLAVLNAAIAKATQS